MRPNPRPTYFLSRRKCLSTGESADVVTSASSIKPATCTADSQMTTHSGCQNSRLGSGARFRAGSDKVPRARHARRLSMGASPHACQTVERSGLRGDRNTVAHIEDILLTYCSLKTASSSGARANVRPPQVPARRPMQNRCAGHSDHRGWANRQGACRACSAALPTSCGTPLRAWPCRRLCQSGSPGR